jgi:hypothetical protein
VAGFSLNLVRPFVNNIGPWGICFLVVTRSRERKEECHRRMSGGRRKRKKKKMTCCCVYVRVCSVVIVSMGREAFSMLDFYNR